MSASSQRAGRSPPLRASCTSAQLRSGLQLTALDAVASRAHRAGRASASCSPPAEEVFAAHGGRHRRPGQRGRDGGRRRCARRVGQPPRPRRSHVGRASYVAGDVGAAARRPPRGPALRLAELEPDAAVEALGRGDLDLRRHARLLERPTAPLAEAVRHALEHEEVLLGDCANTRRTTRPGAARLADLAHGDWVIPHAELACAEMVAAPCGAPAFNPDIVAEATATPCSSSSWPPGIGVALVPRSAVQGWPDGVRLLPVHRRVETHHFALAPLVGSHGMRQLLELLTAARPAPRRTTAGPRRATPPQAN